jgi:hypothetical protein
VADAKVEAVVGRVFGTYCFATDDWGVEYFVHKKNVSEIGDKGWDWIAARAGDYRTVIEGLPVQETMAKWILLEVKVIE